tara:strand:- start:3428 stop:4999 length:1572 start_codon:yes stop_codon:yes gene_type:complete
VQRNNLFAFLLVVVYILSLPYFPVAKAQDNSVTNSNELIILENPMFLESDEFISGYSYYDLPYFNYRLESVNQFGYSNDLITNIMSEVINFNESDGLWYWELSVSFPEVGCSCKLHIYQLDYNFQILATTVISVWVGEQSSSSETLFNPIIYEQNQESNSEDKFLKFNTEFDFIADVFQHSSNSSSVRELVGEFTSASIFTYGNDELVYFEPKVEVNYLSDPSTNNFYQIILTMSSSNLTEGHYLIKFEENILNLWNLVYYFEIDRTTPIVIIEAQSEVNEGDELVLINANSSFDPELDKEFGKVSELEFSWVFEDSDGNVQVPNNNMIRTESSLEFVPRKSGEYKFTVIVEDEAGNKNQSTHFLKVNNIIPEAVITDINGDPIDDLLITFNSSVKELFFSGELSTDSINEINDLQFGWYLDGLLHSSNNSTTIYLENLGPNFELELIVKDSDGGYDNLLLKFNALEDINSEKIVTARGANFFNGLNLVLTTIFLCTLALLVIKKKSTKVDPLPKWSHHNKKE